MALRRFVAAMAISASSALALYINGSVTAPCDSPLYCQGDILKAIELAHPFADSKTFVDLPTKLPLEEVIANFNKLTQPLSNNTELQDFLANNFYNATYQINRLATDRLTTNATFLNKIDDAAIKEFSQAVIDIWPELTRTLEPLNCTGCVSSYLELPRSFVVAGGRFREPYYWDSYWIAEGLLRTGGSFVGITKNIIENFLDFVDKYGFVPNGARIYYLNRSQPPLLSQMVRIYIEHTNDTSILEKAIPLLIKEHEFFMNNRSVEVSAKNGQTYELNIYNVNNNQPRPESYREDWITANNQSYWSPTSNIIYPETQPLSDTEKATLYRDLASGAESGWDYGTRWLRNPYDAEADVYFPLRSLNTHEIVPVDLNSILYRNEVAIGEFLKLTGNETEAKKWAAKAEKRSEAMFAVMWNSTLWSYFDYNLTSSSQNIYIPADQDATVSETSVSPDGKQVFFNVAQLFPFWTGAAPQQLKKNPLAVLQAYKRVDEMLKLKKGAIPATNYQTGQQWDEPNVWPPLMHVLMEGLLNTPATFGKEDPSYVAVQNLAIRLGQRYLDSTFCTWLATGGSTSETPRLQGFTNPNATGVMFEKYSDTATNARGGGGEYEVVEGFGWTNGVLLWTVDTFAEHLKRPDCGNITANDHSDSEKKRRSLERRAVELDPWDMKWVGFN